MDTKNNGASSLSPSSSTKVRSTFFSKSSPKSPPSPVQMRKPSNSSSPQTSNRVTKYLDDPDPGQFISEPTVLVEAEDESDPRLFLETAMIVTHVKHGKVVRYAIQVQTFDGKVVQFEKRYSEFRNFYNSLTKEFPTSKVKFPSKHSLPAFIGNKVDSSFLRARENGLNDFIKKVARTALYAQAFTYFLVHENDSRTSPSMINVEDDDLWRIPSMSPDRDGKRYLASPARSDSTESESLSDLRHLLILSPPMEEIPELDDALKRLDKENIGRSEDAGDSSSPRKTIDSKESEEIASDKTNGAVVTPEPETTKDGTVSKNETIARYLTGKSNASQLEKLSLAFQIDMFISLPLPLLEHFLGYLDNQEADSFTALNMVYGNRINAIEAAIRSREEGQSTDHNPTNNSNHGNGQEGECDDDTDSDGTEKGDNDDDGDDDVPEEFNVSYSKDVPLLKRRSTGLLMSPRVSIGSEGSEDLNAAEIDQIYLEHLEAQSKGEVEEEVVMEERKVTMRRRSTTIGSTEVGNTTEEIVAAKDSSGVPRRRPLQRSNTLSESNLSRRATIWNKPEEEKKGDSEDEEDIEEDIVVSPKSKTTWEKVSSANVATKFK